MAAAVRRLVQLRKSDCCHTYISTATKNVIASIFGSVRSPAYSWVAFITNRRLVVSVERGGEVLREIFKAIFIAQFVTPSESRLREKLFSRNAEQLCSPLISLLLAGCTCIFDIGEQYVFADTGVLHFYYRRTNLHVWAYVRTEYVSIFIGYTVHNYT